MTSSGPSDFDGAGERQSSANANANANANAGAGESVGLERRDATEVLRYWQALLRYEEALSLRPRARRPGAGERPALNWAAPVPGQDYMKLPLAGVESFFVEQKGRVRQPLDGERLAFFEHWLAGRYRQAEEESKAAHLALFPIVHTPREELLGLLRFPVEVAWWSGERRFEVPTPAERRGTSMSRELPGEIEIWDGGKDADEGQPFFVDLRLLRETLRVDGEGLDAFFALLREEEPLTGREMVAALCLLLSNSIEGEEREGSTSGAAGAAASVKAESSKAEGSEKGAKAAKGKRVPGAGESPAVLLERLHGLIARRLRQLGSRCRAFPVALVVASERSRTTWHVQRDLEAALGLVAEGGLRAESPLGAYLSGRASAGRERVCLGRWPRAPLTASQRVALEHALGSSFAAVQGPPGTGKTTVILNLVAHQLIEKCRLLAEASVMGGDFVLVTSTNNRAVDNVVEPLSQEEFSELPLCLRVGNRALMEKVTARTLERVQGWLTRQPENVDPAELVAARQAFSAALARVDARTRVAREAYEQRAELAALMGAQRELALLGAKKGRQELGALAEERVAAVLDPAAPEARARALAADAPWRAAPRTAALAVASLVRALDKMAEQCEEESPAALQRVTAMFQRLETQQLTTLGSALGAKPLLAGPRGKNVSLDDWADALSSAVGPLSALEKSLERWANSEQAGDKLKALQARITALSAAVAAPAKDALPSQASDTDAESGEGDTESDAAAEAGTQDGEEDGEEDDADFRVLFQRAVELRMAWLRQHRAPLLKTLELAIVACRNLRSLRTLLDSPKAAGSWLRQLFPSLGCTLLSLGNALKPDAPSCRQVVIDEAGQCPSAYAVSALLRAHSALLIGDVHQLEPVVGLSREDERRIVRGLSLKLSAARLAPYQMFDESGNSAQSVADRAVPLRPSLRDHFRCQASIIALPEAWCSYGLTVRTPPRSRSGQAPRLSAATLFQDCPGSQERFAGSWVNPAEIEQVLAWLGYLLQQGILPSEIGVITPFRSQAEALSRQLSAARIPLARAFEEEEADANLELFGAQSRGSGVAVGTVHRFQGGERSIILFSSTLTRAANLRFVDERVNLLNVAVSRAKEHFLAIGHEATLNAGHNTRRLVSGAERTWGF